MDTQSLITTSGSCLTCQRHVFGVTSRMRVQMDQDWFNAAMAEEE